MKKGFYAILAALTVLALVITGCPPDGGNGGDPPSNYNRLTSIKLGGGAVLPSGTAKATIAEIITVTPEEALVTFDQLDDSDKSSSQSLSVTLNYSSTLFLGTAKVAFVSKGVSLTEADFTEEYNKDAPPQKVFKDEDKIYIQMTAQNGAVNFYVYEISIGGDANLKEIYFDTEDYKPQTVGEPSRDLDTLKASTNIETFGKFNFQKKPGEVEIFVTPNDPYATSCEISADAGTTWESTGTKLTFTDEDADLYVRVISPNGRKTNYYRIQLFFLRELALPYGTPAKWKIETETIADIESAFADATEWQYINRWNTTETSAWQEQSERNRTFGRAKLMWDVDGVWIYAQVWERMVSPVGADIDGAGEHTKSSVELFIVENDDNIGKSGQTVASSVNTNGGQYRLGANGERSGPQQNQRDAFNALNQTSAKKFDTMPSQDFKQTNITGGYMVVYHAPWLFSDTYKLVKDKKISLEIQINTMDDTGLARSGVLNWNNASSNSYNSLELYGEGSLDWGTLSDLPAQKANITKQPKGQKVTLSTGTFNELAVTAVAKNNETLSYQWYEATAQDDFSTGTVISGATGATYTPTASNATTKDFFYYVEVKTSNTVGGTPYTNTVNSNIVKVAVGDFAPPLEIDVSGDKGQSGMLSSDYAGLTIAITVADSGNMTLTELAKYETVTIKGVFKNDSGTELKTGTMSMFFSAPLGTDGNFTSGNYGGYNSKERIPATSATVQISALSSEDGYEGSLASWFTDAVKTDIKDSYVKSLRFEIGTLATSTVKSFEITSIVFNP